MGKASHFFSEAVGVGTRAKLVINALMTTMMGAFAESLVLSQNVGLDPLKIIEVIGQGAIQSPMYALKGPKMLQSDHAPNFPLKHAHKDIKLACDMAEASGSSYRITAAAESLYQLSMTDTDLNVADEDFSAIFEKINRDSMHDD
jgi:3-hydroxyisobutyrate dehydrogenase-like beta-hydroxyacid dehydrogenase